jgi:hypothetical protein
MIIENRARLEELLQKTRAGHARAYQVQVQIILDYLNDPREQNIDTALFHALTSLQSFTLFALTNEEQRELRRLLKSLNLKVKEAQETVQRKLTQLQEKLQTFIQQRKTQLQAEIQLIREVLDD